MSQDFMDPELFADFIIEAKEHLETIEPNLLELEKEPDNLSLLNEIFRPMHSLKGASGFLGLNKINGLAHKAENILDELRKGSMAVNSEIMDIILASTDALRQIIDNLETENSEGDVDTGPLIQTLDALMAGELPAAAPQTDHEAPDAPATATAEPSPSSAPQDTADASEPDGSEADASEPDGSKADGSEFDDPESDTADNARQGGDVALWLSTREKLPTYTLTAFGEGHLRDFIEEAGDNIAQLSDGLLQLEKEPEGQTDVVNDLFRYFHNLKGNSGIIAFQELNSLTHEAETLLNSVRKDESHVSGPLVDLLLLVVDTLEGLIHSIDPASGSVTPFDISELLEKLRQAVAGEAISLPESLLATSQPEDEDRDALPDAKNAGGTGHDAAGPEESGAEATSAHGLEGDPEDIAVFKSTVDQQFSHIDEALKGMRTDGANREYADAMYRSLSTVQNSSGFMGLEEIKQYAHRTAGIVDQGRNSGLDFSIMADLLEQECAIIRDMIKDAIGSSLEGYTPEDDQEDDSPAPESKGDAAPVAEAAGDQGGKQQAAAAGPTEAPAPPDEAAAPAAPAPPEQKQDDQNVHPRAPVAAPAEPVPAPAQAKAAAKPASKPAPPKSNGKGSGGQNDAGSKASATIRVDHEKLDHLMNLIGELIINRNRYAMLARQLEGSSNVDVSEIAQNLTETTYSMARISDDLQDTIMKVRMVPVASVFSRFPRLVRDLSRKSGKEVELIMEGEDTELDKNVVEVIGDPLVHLIRNSVDHGIEPEDVRLERGKPAKGSVWLRAFYKGNSVAIEIEDDGKGIDPEKMREVAVRKGIISLEEAKALDDREAMELIFAPGFSSAEVITDISGRGVGMDVVRTNIKNLKGSISINSEVGKGTKFTLSLPLTLAIIDALMVNVDDQMYAIPLDAVSETNKIESERLTDVKGRKAITLRGEVLGIVSLAEVLGLPVNVSMDEQEMLSLVIIQDNDRRLGLVVDRLLERQEIVIKPLGAYLGDLRGISGATIMGDGSVILILDPHEIYSLSTSKSA